LYWIPTTAASSPDAIAHSAAANIRKVNTLTPGELRRRNAIKPTKMEIMAEMCRIDAENE
jgi:hypothetical protein